MSKPWKATALLIGAVLAACAFAAPTMALGPSWGTVGTQHLLTSANLGFDAHVTGGIAGIRCAHTQMPTDVWQITRLTVTSVTFSGCQGTGTIANCTPTLQATGLPWTVTGPFPTNVVLDGVQILVLLENRPGAFCGISNPSSITGSVGGGNWAFAQHQIHYATDTGLTAHMPGLLTGPAVTTTTGTLRDATQTLTG
jgi:hypothetical protein